VKKELLFTDARASEDDRLLEELDEVRDSLGGTSGIWQTLQDSIGSDMARGDGKTASYREFCSLISDASEKVWLWRLINFFADIQNDEQQKVVTDSLAALLRLRGLLDPDGTPLSAQRSSLGTAVAPPSSPGRGRITG
jgi:hypothetical protein